MSNKELNANDINESMITTIDNPFNPFDDFDNWYRFDCEKGYYTCSKLARVTLQSDALSDYENGIEIEKGIDTLIEYDILNIYRKVTPADYK